MKKAIRITQRHRQAIRAEAKEWAGWLKSFSISPINSADMRGRRRMHMANLSVGYMGSLEKHMPLLPIHPMMHSYVKLRGFEFDPHRNIVLVYKDSIVVPVSYADELPEDCPLLTKFDEQGNSMAMVPRNRVEAVLTDEEMESIMECEHIDQQMLRNAR